MIAEVPAFAFAFAVGMQKPVPVAAATVSIAAVAATSVVGSKTDEPAVETIRAGKGRFVRGPARLLLPRAR